MKMEIKYSENTNECRDLENELIIVKKTRENYNDEYFVKSSILEEYSHEVDVILISNSTVYYLFYFYMKIIDSFQSF